MNQEYGIESGSALEWVDWCKMIKEMNRATYMKFLHFYFIGVMNRFIIPTTKTAITSRCYQPIVDHNDFGWTNFGQFAINQMIIEVKKMGVKKKYGVVVYTTLW
jgi:hypothetical protein